MNTLGSVLLTGLLWLLCSIPVITLPAASMAAYHTSAKVIRRGKGYVTRVFFEAFLRQLKRWLPVAFCDLLVLVWLLFDIIYLHGYGTEFTQSLLYIIYGILLLYVAMNTVFFPCASRYGGGRFNVFKTAFYICFRHIWASALMTLIFAAGLYVMYLMPWSLLVVPGLYWFLSSLIMEGILRRYSRNPDEEDDTDDIFAQLRRKKAEKAAAAAAAEDAEEEDEDEEEDDETGGSPSSGEEVIYEDGEITESRMGNLIIKRRKKARKQEPENDGKPDSFLDRIIRK